MKTQNKTVSIVMPTYNDSHLISFSLESIVKQTYKNIQIVIIDDGSTDNTEEIISTFVHKLNIVYKKQENQGQLNALGNAVPLINGDYVCMLHSDDILVNDDSIAHCVETLEKNTSADGLYGDYIIIDENGKVTGKLETTKFPKETDVLKDVYLLFSSNPIGDHFFVRKAAFQSHVLPNYIKNNLIYHLGYNQRNLKLIKVEPWYCYRVFNENYIQSDIGKFEALSGQFRTISRIFKSGYSFYPDYTCSYVLFRIARKFKNFVPFYIKTGKINYKQAIRYFQIWKKELSRLNYPEILIDIIELIINSIKAQYYNLNERVINISSLEKEYKCSDARMLFKDIKNSKLYESLKNLKKYSRESKLVVNDKYTDSFFKFLSIWY